MACTRVDAWAPLCIVSVCSAGWPVARLKLSLFLFLPYCGACRAERSQSVCPTYKLQLEECLSAEQVPTPELIQGYVKKVGLLYECQPEGFVRCDHLGCREGEIGRHECIVLVFI